MRKLLSIRLWAIALLAVSPVIAGQQSITVDNIRLGISFERTRLVFDADKPIKHPVINGLESQRLVLELPNVVFQKLPASKDYSLSAIESIDIQAGQNGKPTVVRIELKRKVKISVKSYLPNGKRQHRLVMDFYRIINFNDRFAGSSPKPEKIPKSAVVAASTTQAIAPTKARTATQKRPTSAARSQPKPVPRVQTEPKVIAGTKPIPTKTDRVASKPDRAISLSATGQRQLATITNVRLGVNTSRTRLVFDVDEPIIFNRVKGLPAQRLVLKLPNVVFEKVPSVNYASSAIASMEVSSAPDKLSTIVSITLKQTAKISVAPYAANDTYGHRLVLDFNTMKPISQPVAKPEQPKPQRAKPKPTVPASTTPTGPTQIAQAARSRTMQSPAVQKPSGPLFVKAQHALAVNDFANAMTLYQRLMNDSDEAVSRKALEFYAVTLERSGKKARAKLEYTNYISRYPDSEDIVRVRQRLNAMLSLEQRRPELRVARRSSRKKQGFETWGVFFEDYRLSEMVNNEGDSDTRLSSAYSVLDANARYRGKNIMLSMRLSGGYENSFLAPDPEPGNLSYFYFDAEHQSSGTSMRLGRQRQRSGGTIGRFDGINLSSNVGDAFKLNLVAGYPVERSSDLEVNTERDFYGVSTTIGPFFKAMDINLFYVNQRIGDLTDREAVGGEFKYFNDNYFVSGYVDYDIHFEEFNALLFNSRYTFERGTNVSFGLNYRKSPYLTTKNALIGQQVDDIIELRDQIMGIDELEALALDRTIDSKSANLYIDHPLTKKLSINTSITVSELSDTPASGGVPAFEGTDMEYFVSTQLAMKGLFSKRDSGRVGFSFAERTQSEIYSFFGNYRFQLGENWRLYPRFAVQRRDNINGTDQIRYSLLLRSEYKIGKNQRLDTQLGGDWYKNNNALGGKDQFELYFFSLVYTYFL